MSKHPDAPGLIMGSSAYVMWGVFPFYFYLLSSVSSWEVLAHRIVWSVLALALLLGWRGRLRGVFSTLASPRQAGLLGLASLLIALNWLVYIYAVATHRTIDASMGYFINPVLLILLGILVFKERLNKSQTACIMLAGAGIAYQFATLGGFSWISLVLPAAFGGYGAIKKHLHLDSIGSLFLETLMVAPLVLIYLGWQARAGDLALLNGTTLVQVLLVASGVVTATPLLLFAEGAKRLPLYVMGFLQYITPTMQFSIGLFAFGEPLNNHKLIGFIFVWAGLAVLAAGQMHSLRTRREMLPAPEVR